MYPIGQARHTLVAGGELPHLAEYFAAVSQKPWVSKAHAGPAALFGRRYGELLVRFNRLDLGSRSGRSSEGL